MTSIWIGVLVTILAGATGAHADVFVDRSFGLDVDPGGGTGFENCTSATGCPDAPITRGQVAKFLGQALGLHFGP